MTAKKRRVQNRHITTGGAIKHSNVLYAADRFSALRSKSIANAAACVIKPDFQKRYCTTEEPFDIPTSFRHLPFLKIIRNRGRSRVANYWTDIPTADGRADFRRGRTYAALTMVAVSVDAEQGAWHLERIVKAIVMDSASRKPKGRKHNPSLTPAAEGYLHELFRQLWAKTA